MNKIILIVLMALSFNANAMTAYFTGNQEQVQTVSYQYAWRCEYQAFGNYFWAVFKNSCPMTLEVY